MTGKTEPCFKITPLEFPIFLIEVNEHEEVDAIQTEMMRDRLEAMANGGEYLVLLDVTNNYTVTSESRKLIADKQFASKRVAAAFVVRSVASRITGNFFIKINKPHTPVRLFENKTEALEWLRTFIRSKI